MRRLALVTGALVLPVLPLIAAGPATAVDNVICVGSGLTGCTQTVATVQAAITMANSNGVDDTILIAHGTYAEAHFAFSGAGANHGLTVIGAGSGPAAATSTILTAPADGFADVFTDHATLQNLRITMNPASPTNDVGLGLTDGSSADNVVVDGTATHLTQVATIAQSTLTHSSVLGDPSISALNVGLTSNGGDTISDTTITGYVGYRSTGTNGVDVASRLSIRSDGKGVTTDNGTIDLDDSVVDLGTAGAGGLCACNNNPGTGAMAINADHVTIVGGAPGSLGVSASVTSDQPAMKTATVSLTNSIVRGPQTSLGVEASTGGPQNSTATITTSYSDWQTSSNNLGPHGSGAVISGTGHLDVDPAFVAASDFQLAPGSPVTDKGNPAFTGAATDLAGHGRVLDGDGNSTAVTDMGAYELPAVPDTFAPNTSLSKKPARRFARAKAKIGFTSEAGATFECKLDRGAWKACTSPDKVKVRIGKHTFSVRAIDPSGNVDPSPATVKFRRIKKEHHHH